jgi:hypothetical protein
VPIVIAGKTICKICGKVIENNDDIIAFPPIISNSKDPLYLFHDAAFHLKCFNSHPNANRMRTVWDQANQRTRPLKCEICTQLLHYSEDFLPLGLLSSDPNNPLFHFNYMIFHKHHLTQWPELSNVYNLLLKIPKESWGGNILENLIQEISKWVKQT